MLGLNSTNGSGEGGRLAVAQAAALSRVEDTGGESLQNLLLYRVQTMQKYVLAVYYISYVSVLRRAYGYLYTITS